MSALALSVQLLLAVGMAALGWWLWRDDDQSDREAVTTESEAPRFQPPLRRRSGQTVSAAGPNR